MEISWKYHGNIMGLSWKYHGFNGEWWFIGLEKLGKEKPETQETLKGFSAIGPIGGSCKFSIQSNVVFVNTGSKVCPKPLQLALVKFIWYNWIDSIPKSVAVSTNNGLQFMIQQRKGSERLGFFAAPHTNLKCAFLCFMQSIIIHETVQFSVPCPSQHRRRGLMASNE